MNIKPQIKYSEKSYKTSSRPSDISQNYQSHNTPIKTYTQSNLLSYPLTSNSSSKFDKIQNLKSKSILLKESPSSNQNPYLRKKKIFNYVKTPTTITPEFAKPYKNPLNQSRSFTSFTFPQNQINTPYKYSIKNLQMAGNNDNRRSTSISKPIQPINMKIINKYIKYPSNQKNSKSISSNKRILKKSSTLTNNMITNPTYVQYSPKPLNPTISSFTYMKQKPPTKKYISKIMQVNNNSNLSTSYSNKNLSNFQSIQYDMPQKQLQTSSFIYNNDLKPLNISDFTTIGQSSYLKKYTKIVNDTKIPNTLKNKLIKKKEMNSCNIIHQSSPPQPIKSILLQSSYQ